MKVLVLAPPLRGAGGIQRYTACLLRALREVLGEANVHCLALSDPSSASGRIPAASKLRFAWQALRESFRLKPDLFICAHLALGPVARVLASLRRRPYWVAVYGIEAWSVLPYWKTAALRHARRLITLSAFSREQVGRRHKINSRRMLDLPGMLDETLLQFQPAATGRQTQIPEGRRVVLSVARMTASERYKGHDVVLHALPQVLARVPELSYAVVGGGDDRPRLERLAAELGIGDHVCFTGEVSDSELAALYRRSEAFALPARTVLDKRRPKGEGFGLVFLEAMAFGKPVVGPNYGAPAEFIRDGQNGLRVDPESPAAIAEALLLLLESPDEARRMGEFASRWVRENYSFASFCQRLREILATAGEGRCELPPTRAALETSGANPAGNGGVRQ